MLTIKARKDAKMLENRVMIFKISSTKKDADSRTFQNKDAYNR